jgi:hypothetical protein
MEEFDLFNTDTWSNPFDSTPDYGQGNDLLQPYQPASQPIGPLQENGTFDDWGWLSDVKGLYEENKGWIDPLVGYGKEYYKSNKAAGLADEYKQLRQPGIDFNKEAIARQRAYMQPGNVDRGVAEDLNRVSGMLTQQYARADQPRFASAFNAGTLGSSTFGRQQATRAAARDKVWANNIVPAAYDQYYSRGTQMSNADTAVAGLFKGDPQLQPAYTQANYRSDPWGNAVINYFDGA